MVTLMGILGLGVPLRAVQEQKIPWAFEVAFDVPPDEGFPPWNRAGNGEAWIENGKLRIKSDLLQGMAFTLRGGEGDSVWDGTKASTVRFRVRVISSENSDTAAHVSIRAGDRYFLIPIKDTEEKEYHFLFEEAGDGRLFINGIEDRPVKARALQAKDHPNSLMFGDLGSATGGETEWSEFRWTNTGAFEP